MVFKTTFNNISVISWRLVLLVRLYIVCDILYFRTRFLLILEVENGKQAGLDYFNMKLLQILNNMVSE